MYENYLTHAKYLVLNYLAEGRCRGVKYSIKDRYYYY